MALVNMTSALLAIGYVANLVIIITRGATSAAGGGKQGTSASLNPTLPGCCSVQDLLLVYDGGGEPALSNINLSLQSGPDAVRH